MSKKYPGGLITKTPITPTGPYENGSASGVWSIEQMQYWMKQGLWPIAGNTDPGDPYFKYVTLLLNGNGTNGAQNNTFVDSSSNAFSITRNGNTTQGSFSPYGNLWSNYFNGSSDYLSVANNAALQFGTGDFTIECWIYVSSFSATVNAVISKRYTSAVDTTWAIDFEANNGNLRYRILNSTGGVITVPIGTVSLNTWTHIAVSKQSGTTRTYLNGIAGSTTTNSTSIDGSTYNLKIGGGGTGAGEYINGYISNARIVKGTAVYTSAFTPSTTPLTAVSGTSLLTCQSNRFIDNSSNAFAVTVTGTPSVQRFSPFNPTASYSTATIGGSGYFDGSGDYLSTPSSGQFQATGNFTISCWIYLTNPSRMWNQILGNYGTASPGNDVIFEIYNDGTINYYFNGNTISSSAGVIKYNAWNYISLVRSSSTCTGYVNGVSVGTTSYSGQVGQASASYNIGRSGPSNPSDSTLGYISDVRFVDGTAITTVPTSPLTAVSGTNLLCNFTNAGIPDSAMMNDLETVGNAQVSTSVKKFGTGSIAFDGTGDYLKSNANTSLYTFGTGDFTVEFWMYSNSFASTATLYDGRPDGNDGSSQPFVCIFQDTSGQVGLFVLNTTQITSSALSTSTWYHVAVCRSGTSTKMFINGTQVGSTYTDSNNYLCGTNRPSIGANGYSSGSFSYNGYIDDLRITKGYARYTANFTPPTSAFYTY